MGGWGYILGRNAWVRLVVAVLALVALGSVIVGQAQDIVALRGAEQSFQSTPICGAGQTSGNCFMALPAALYNSDDNGFFYFLRVDQGAYQDAFAYVTRDTAGRIQNAGDQGDVLLWAGTPSGLAAQGGYGPYPGAGVLVQGTRVQSPASPGDPDPTAQQWPDAAMAAWLLGIEVLVLAGLAGALIPLASLVWGIAAGAAVAGLLAYFPLDLAATDPGTARLLIPLPLLGVAVTVMVWRYLRRSGDRYRSGRPIHHLLSKPVADTASPGDLRGPT